MAPRRPRQRGSIRSLVDRHPLVATLPYAGTVFLSSFLLFLVQPIIAKQILPWFGGSAAVWTTCLVFFQSVLLAGYAYADLTTRLGARRQALLHVGLLALSNLASLIALLGFPLLFEPAFDQTQLGWGWSALFAGFAFLCAATAWL